MSQQYFATCPKGLESLLFYELKQLGADELRETVAGVYFSGDLSTLYRACLWSRLANKVLLPLSYFPIQDENSLYQAISTIDWSQHLSSVGSFKVDFLGTNKVIRNSQYGAVRIKDAIVDQFQARVGQRPTVDKQKPDITINAHLGKGKVHLSLDVSGESLHRRGYRQQQGIAPLKENLAAAILYRADWPSIVKQGGFLLDPMCGSATLLIEGVLMAADMAPGQLRQTSAWGFIGWEQHDESLWQLLLEEANQRKETGLKQLRSYGFEARGYDHDWRVLQAAESNIQTSGLSEFVRVAFKPLTELTKPTHKAMDRGLVVSNPPYGERLGEEKQLIPLYQGVGKLLREEFNGWQAAMISSNPNLAKQVGISKQKTYKFWNGTIPAELFIYRVQPNYFYKHLDKHSPWGRSSLDFDSLTEGGKMVCNRLRKNQKQLRKWIEKEAIECYRLYDADIPEYAAAVDVYADAVHVQEYKAPSSVDENKSKQRFHELLDAVAVALELDESQIFIKQRQRNKGKKQYEKLADKKNERKPLVVREGNASFFIDLWSYLDTGLFLDHRPVRQLIAKLAPNKRLLNLFCYTATASVHAALAGATSSVSVDLSKTYINWAKQNYELNHLNRDRHQLVQQDCFTWLQQCREGFDLIFLDPPSFSNSKRMEQTLDIQHDHVALIQRCAEILSPKGILIFSTNLRSFKLDHQALITVKFENITKTTLDPDFQRNQKIHQCWKITNY